MSVTVLTAATSRRLTTANALYAETGDVHYLEEPSLTNALIDQASMAIESWCGRIFAQQRYEETLPQAPEPTLILRHRPVVSIASVLAGDAVTDYRLDPDTGILSRRYGWGRTWGWDDLVVDYIAGYILPEQTNPPAPLGPTLPYDIQRACIECAKVWFAEREPSQRVQSRTLGDQRIEYSIQAGRTALPVLAEHALMPYRTWVMR